jgi:hypothetical protein
MAKDKQRRNIKKQRKTPAMSVVATPAGLPARYPTVAGDSVVVHGKFSHSATAPATAPFIDKGLIVLGRGSDSTGYHWLNGLSTLFNGLSAIYDKFMVMDLKVTARGVGGTANSLGAISYIASNTSTDNPPTTLAEATQAAHAAQFVFGTPGKFQVKPMSYFGDWRNCNDSDNSDGQAGLIQYYALGTAASNVIAIFEIEYTIAFAGLTF